MESSATALAPARRPRRTTTAPYQRLADSDRGTGGESLANFLGLFSLGLGLAQVAAPGALSKVVGVEDDDQHRLLMRLMGLREISHGLAILSNQQPKKAVWSRVAGDTLDLAMLGLAMTNSNNKRNRTLFAAMNVLAVTALDVMAAKTLSMQPDTEAHQLADEGIIHTRKVVTVGAPVDEVRERWNAFGAEWKDLTTVEFRSAPKDYGTEVRVDLEYEPKFGKLGSKFEMIFRNEPGQRLEYYLRHFKQLVEIGEIVVSDASNTRGPHPANPA
jgi:uncharacterized membrane protein